ncbi:zinc finger BED domain-containing protein 5 [Trichonephila clavipes]|nr:zinc finger BED domain-containing protein 5 [Trichonephila clavipes]
MSAAGRRVVGKFMSKFEGPYRVLQVRNNNLIIWKKGKRVTVNIDQLRVYHPRQFDTISLDSHVDTLYEEQRSSNGTRSRSQENPKDLGKPRLRRVLTSNRYQAEKGAGNEQVASGMTGPGRPGQLRAEATGQLRGDQSGLNRRQHSNDEEPMRHFCPIDDTSWCKYQKAVATNSASLFKHKNNVPIAIMDKIKPIIAELSAPKLLKKCVGAMLAKNFKKYFLNEDSLVASYEWIRDLFQDTPKGLSTSEEEIFIDFPSSEKIKRQFCNKSLFEFGVEVDEELSVLKTKALRILLPFSTSYLFKPDFLQWMP